MVELERVTVGSREELRAWLEAHHEQSESIWLATYKKAAGDKYVSYNAIVEEALCFGWVDSRPAALDELRSMLLLSPRRPGSAWSKLNKDRVKKLRRAGLMTPAGQAKVDQAKADGSWSFLDDVEALVIPDDLGAMLEKDGAAMRNFESFSDSSKKNILQWIKTAKREATRAKRIAETVRLAARGLRANHPRG